MAQAIGMDYTDFKQMLSNDVWPEVSRRHIDVIVDRRTAAIRIDDSQVSFSLRDCICVLKKSIFLFDISR